MADDTTTRSPFGIEPPHPELERLQPLVGGWKVEDHTQDSVLGPGVPVTSTERFGWLEGGYFLVQTYDTVFGDEPAQKGVSYWYTTPAPEGSGSSSSATTEPSPGPTADAPAVSCPVWSAMKRRRAANDSAPAEWLSSPTWVGTIVGDDRDHVGHSDLARVRFAHSPVEELVASLRVLQDPGRQLMYGRWVSATRGRLGGLRLDLLAALAPTGRYLPAFLFPPSTRPWGVPAEELAQVAASPPAVVRAELDKVREGGPLPAVLEPLYDDPAGQLPAVVEEMGRYWEAAIEPVWPRVRGLCAADLAHRMEQFAGGGLARVLGDLHPDLGFADELLRVDKPHHCSHRFDLAGTGIVLVPCAFTWPSLSVDCCGVDQPALIYLPRGVAELWEDTLAEQPDPLSALVGRTRASLLAILAVPGTTTQLAERLELSPAAVSQHLKILKDAALVSAHRRGRMILYQRTPAATTLLEAIPSDQASSG